MVFELTWMASAGRPEAASDLSAGWRETARRRTIHGPSWAWSGAELSNPAARATGRMRDFMGHLLGIAPEAGHGAQRLPTPPWGGEPVHTRWIRSIRRAAGDALCRERVPEFQVDPELVAD